MTKRLAHLVLCLLAVVGALCGTPAVATHDVGLAAVFVGSAAFGPGELAYPVTGTPRTGWWTFTFGQNGVPVTGVGATTYGTVGLPYGGVSGVHLHSGDLQQGLAGLHPALDGLDDGAFCGADGGEGGEGTISVLDDQVQGLGVAVDVRNVGWTQSAATLLVLTGDAGWHLGGEPELYGVLSAVPRPDSGSCAAGTAWEFIVVGAAVITP